MIERLQDRELSTRVETAITDSGLLALDRIESHARQVLPFVPVGILAFLLGGDVKQAARRIAPGVARGLNAGRE